MSLFLPLIDKNIIGCGQRNILPNGKFWNKSIALTIFWHEVNADLDCIDH